MQSKLSTMSDDLLTLAEVAEILGVRQTRLRTWRNRGQGPKSWKIGVSVVYNRSDVDAWIAAGRPLRPEEAEAS